MNRQRRLVMLALAMPLLASCSALVGRREEVVVYAPRLSLPQVTDVRAARSWQLVIAQPQAIAPYDGARLVVMPKPGEIEFYRGARWPDETPVMLHELLLRAHEKLVGVASPGNGMRADFALRTSLRDFRAEYRDGDRAPLVVVCLSAQFIAASTGRVFAARVFSIEEPAAGTRVAEVFAAFERAINQLLEEIVAWSLDSGDTAWNAQR